MPCEVCEHCVRNENYFLQHLLYKHFTIEWTSSWTEPARNWSCRSLGGSQWWGRHGDFQSQKGGGGETRKQKAIISCRSFVLKKKTLFLYETRSRVPLNKLELVILLSVVSTSQVLAFMSNRERPRLHSTALAKYLFRIYLVHRLALIYKRDTDGNLCLIVAHLIMANSMSNDEVLAFGPHGTPATNEQAGQLYLEHHRLTEFSIIRHDMCENSKRDLFEIVKEEYYKPRKDKIEEKV